MSQRARTPAWIVGVLAACALTPPAMAAGRDATTEPGVRGRVEAATSRWATGDDLIVTDVVVHTVDGERVTLTVLGGTVDGIGMALSHHPPPLAVNEDVVLVPDRHGVRAHRLAPTHAAALAPHAGAARVGVQRTSRSGRVLHHPSGCLTFTYAGRGTSRLGGDPAWAAVDEAFEAWESATKSLSCGSVQFSRFAVANATEGRDGVNTVRFRDDTWCRPATLTEPEVCHSPDAVGVTRVLYIDDPASPRDGEIVEVDIEINGVDFALTADGRAGTIDLASAVAHEVGHALGLEHNGGLAGGAWPTGPDGAPVADCESLPLELGEATMYYQVTPGTTRMRSPELSDLEGMCSVLSASCDLRVTGGCSATGGGSTGPVLGTLLAGLLVLRRRWR